MGGASQDAGCDQSLAPRAVGSICYLVAFVPIACPVHSLQHESHLFFVLPSRPVASHRAELRRSMVSSPQTVPSLWSHKKKNPLRLVSEQQDQ